MRQSIASSRSSALPVWAAPAASFLVWAAATASLVAWGLAFWPNDGRPLANSVSMETASNRAGALTSNLGSPSQTDAPTANLGKVLGAVSVSAVAEPAAPSLVSRLALLGIAKSGKEFSALIAVDGQAAKPFAKGTEVLPGLVLQSVNLQQAHLGASLGGPVQLSLDMPKRAEPARGMVQ